ncbi:putative RDD family membrane protein YckC [Catenulispora sp. GP43]|uniref:RDD family protein n=1 Tax=Catenulispora sp. GP43 TaxID=3156263 RepID=UPI0035194499
MTGRRTTSGEEPSADERNELNKLNEQADRHDQHEQYSGLVTRLAALSIDAVLLLIASVAVGFGVPALWSSVEGSVPGWLKDGSEVVAALLPLLYFWLSWCVTCQTLGGMLFGIAVLRPDGSRVGVPRAAARAFFGLLFAPIWLVGMVITVLDPRRRAAHDILMGTVVRRV